LPNIDEHAKPISVPQPLLNLSGGPEKVTQL